MSTGKLPSRGDLLNLRGDMIFILVYNKARQLILQSDLRTG